MALIKINPWSVLFVTVITTLIWKQCTGVGLHKEGSDFCYTEPECGPGSDEWAPQCHDGVSQSPISLPLNAQLLPGVTSLELNSYRSDAFRMQNNGHTVHVELLQGSDGSNILGGTSPLNAVFSFPDPFLLSRYNRHEAAFYKFDSAHFHWGARDHVGSEHCFDHRCFSMELHLVHHLSTYDTMAEALESGDSNALAVIAVVFDVTPAAGPGNPVLAPIVDNLFQIEESSHDDWSYINAPLDFTPLLATGKPTFMYSYKGSLTTPDCNEQVNWYVFKRPIAISHRDVNAFRFIRDNRGELLKENHRPIQNRNGRAVYVSAVQPL